MNTTKNQEALFSYLLQAKNAKQMAQRLDGLLTPSELKSISTRLQIAQMLKQGIPQREIATTLGVGIATVTRGSRELKAGKL